MNRKQWLIGILCACLLLAVGCGKQTQQTQPDAAPTATVETTAASEEAQEQPETAPETGEGPETQTQPAQQPVLEEKQTPPEAQETGDSAAQGQTQPAEKPAEQPPIQQAEEQQSVQVEPPQENIVYLSVEVPGDGTTIIDRTSVTLEDGDTAYSVLRRVAKERGIPVVSSGGSKNVYIEGIDNLFEFDRGAGSGWMVSVNGTFEQRSAGQMKLNAGDEVRWLYTLDLGKDIGGGI